MITRRSILAASSSSLLLVPTGAMAQAQEPIAPPTPEEVLAVAKNPDLYRQVFNRVRRATSNFDLATD